MQSSSLQASTDAAMESSCGRPGGAQLERRAVALAGELAEPGGEDLGRGARCGAVVGVRAPTARLRATTRRRRRRTGRGRCRSRGAPGRSRRPGRCPPRRRGPRDRGGARSARCPGASRRRGARGARRRPSRWRTGRVRSVRGSRSARVRGGSSTRARRPGPARRGPGRPGQTQFRTRVQTRVSSGASSRATPTPGGRREHTTWDGGSSAGSRSASWQRPAPRLSRPPRSASSWPGRSSSRRRAGPRTSRILGLDLAAGTITLSSNADSRLPGVYSFWFTGDSGHARLGEIVVERRRHRDPAGPRRRLRRPGRRPARAAERLVPPQPARPRRTRIATSRSTRRSAPRPPGWCRPRADPRSAGSSTCTAVRCADPRRSVRSSRSATPATPR